MRIYQNGDKIEYSTPSLALGNFDGMHLGHIEVFGRARFFGESIGVMLFDTENSPLKKHNESIITTLSEKIEILEKINVDFVYIVPFDADFMNMSGEDFAEFLASVGTKFVTVGYDYRCGKGAEVDSEQLREFLKEYDIETQIVSPFIIDGEIVKSTKIREILSSGDIFKANTLLYTPYSLSGKIVSGLKNGRDMGFPTANIESCKMMILRDGVYYGKVYLSDQIFKAVINIGKNPTFDAEKRTIEAHIIDYDEDIYGEIIKVEFLEKIRDEKKFASVNELIEQIEKDVEYAKGRRI